MIPPVYRSEATILIEEPEVPPELVQSTVTSYADQRIQLIKYHVMTTQTLTQIMNRFDLYPVERRTLPVSEVIEKFREDAQVDIINAQVLNPSSGRPVSATIAFTVAYDNETPRLAQQVANELVTLYLSENARERQGQAAATTKFLGEEADRMAARIYELEQALSDFKQKNSGRLPQQLIANQEALMLAQRDLGDIDRRLEAARERRSFLEAEIARASARGPLTQQMVDTNAERLVELRAAVARLKSTRGPRHPEVLRLEDEIANAEAAGAGPTATAPTLAQARAAQAQAEGFDPVAMQLRTQLNEALVETAAMQTQRRSLQSTIQQYQQRVVDAPEIEREYLTLTRDYDAAQLKYNETRNKQLAAQLAQALEMESKSERFSLIEPPQLPTTPVWPNKPMIIGVGALLAIAAGIGMVLVVDMFDDRIYTGRQLARMTGEFPLVVVPYVYTPRERVRRFFQQFAYTTTIVAVVAVGAVTVHQRVMPLDVLWFKLVATGHDAVAAVR